MVTLRVLVPLACLMIAPAIAFGQKPPAEAPAPPATNVPQPPAAVAPPAPGAPVPPPLPQATQPVQPNPAETVYYVERQGQPVGPLSLEQVLAQIRANQITRQTQVWRSGDPGWIPAGDQAELRAAFAQQPPPVTGAGIYRDLMIGTWQYERTGQMGMRITAQIHFQPDGHYTGVQTTVVMGGRPIAMPISGTWDVSALGAGDRFTLTMTSEGALPSSVVVRMINNSTVYNETESFYARKVGG